MIATTVHADEHGVAHHYCEHHAQTDHHAGHSTNMFRDRFWVSLVLTVPIMVLAPFWQSLFNYRLTFTGANLVTALLGSIIFFYGGLVFLKSARNEIKAKLPGMMTLISLAIVSAYLYSLSVSFGLIVGSDFFWEVSSLIVIMLLGHWIEMEAVGRAQDALGELAKLLPDSAEVIIKEGTKKVPVSQLQVNDLLLIRPGAKIPADGRISKGAGSVNEAMVTGESKPVAKKVGDTVIAGTINGSGSLTVTVERVGEDTTLAGIMRLVAEAQNSKSRSQVLADRAALYLTIVAIVVGIITLNGWLVAGAGVAFALERLVSVFVIACPHALGLAVPLVTSISTSQAAKNGLLVRNRGALENARLVDIVLFDKTGTLTTGEQGVVSVTPVGNLKEAEIIKLAFGLEKDSEHAIGQAIVKYAQIKQMAAATVQKWGYLPGKGVTGIINRQQYWLGGPQLLREHKIGLDDNTKIAVTKADQAGQTVVYLITNQAVVGLVAIADVIRPESAEAIQKLHQLGLKTAVVTGDSQGVADYVAKQVGIDQVLAEVLPVNKVEEVKKLQRQGLRVAMVGDGINDAPALTQADVGIAIGAGTDVAIESAGIILMQSDPRAVTKIFALAKATYNKTVQNLWWAAGYNIVAIPLAAGALASYGLVLQPALAAILMSFSTIIVAANAQLLKKITL